MREIPSDSVEQFLDRFNPRRLALAVGASRDESLYFRGQIDGCKRLLPRAWRSATDDPKATSILDAVRQRCGKVLDGIDGASEHDREANRRRFVEMYLVQLFAAETDRAGMPIPSDRRRDDTRFHPFPDWPSESSPITSLAAHLGLPTRLLDVTFNPLVAAGFAAWGGDAHDGDLGVIVVRGSLLRGAVRLLMYPRAENVYLRAQEGCSLLVDDPEAWFGRLGGRWPALEDVLAPEALVKFTLPARFATELAEALDLVGISPSTLRPSYEGAAAALWRRAELGLVSELS